MSDNNLYTMVSTMTNPSLIIEIDPFLCSSSHEVTGEKAASKFLFESENGTKTAPPGTELLSLDERIRVYISVFESGCSVSQMDSDLRPEDCPECTRAFVEAVKNAVGYETEVGVISSAISGEPVTLE